MIPKRAIFYWEDGGEGPSWLRRQSWASFAALNPGWKIDILTRDPESPIQGDGFLSRVLRSDIARYDALEEGGGYYFDSDIVFFRPVPDSWLNGDVALTVSEKEGHAIHIAAMGSCKGSPFFKMMADLARIRLQEGIPLGYQSLGVCLFSGADIRGVAGQMGQQLIQLPLNSVLTVGWSEPHMCFAGVTDKHRWHEKAIGLHWYGGDHACMEMEKTASYESLSGTLLGKALAATRPQWVAKGA